MSEVSRKYIKGLGRYGVDTKFKGKSLTLTCDLGLESR